MQTPVLHTSASGLQDSELGVRRQCVLAGKLSNGVLGSIMRSKASRSREAIIPSTQHLLHSI